MMDNRCQWANVNPLMIEYHDTEWGVPVHDDRKLYEFMVLDAFQAGLSWAIVLKKREGFNRAFSGFDPEKVAIYDQQKIEELILDEGIIRNRMKINAAVENARAFLRIRQEFGSFDKFIWQFTDHKTIVNTWASIKEVPASSPESDAMSKELKKRGFKFVGTTICYAFMQAAGMINDHITSCFRYDEVGI